MAKTILIVDDEPDICEILRFNLETEGYQALTAEEADEAQKIVSSRHIDLIMLDVMMTPKSGFEWAKELKSNPHTATIPIIFCTAKTMEEDMLHGFDLGSDDYICKPFRISEVKARVKAVLRRAQGSDDTPAANTAATTARNIISYEGIVLDLDRKESYIDGKEIAFTKLEFELLALLLSNPGQVFSRETILLTVWPSDTVVLDRTVDVNITRIRKKIGHYGEHLKSKVGYGYTFIR